MDAASRVLSDAHLSPEDMTRAMRLAAGFQPPKKAIRRVVAAGISAAAQRATRCPREKDLARNWRAWLQRIWSAPPELSAEDPRNWRNLVSTAVLGGSASEERRKKLFEELREILMFAPSDIAELGKYQAYIVTEDPQSNCVLGQLWRAVKVAGGAKDVAERPWPSTYVLQGWGARRLANAIAADSADNSELGRTFSSYSSELGLPAEERDSMGRREKLRRVADGATSSEQISQFARAWGSTEPAQKLRS